VDPLDPKDSWDLKEMLVTQDQQVRQDQLDLEVFKVLLERKVSLDPMVNRDHQDHRDPLVKEGSRECLEYLDQKATEGSLDWTELKERLENLARKEKKVPLVL